jgi:hypothetical protein
MVVARCGGLRDDAGLIPQYAERISLHGNLACLPPVAFSSSRPRTIGGSLAAVAGPVLGWNNRSLLAYVASGDYFRSRDA